MKVVFGKNPDGNVNQIARLFSASIRCFSYRPPQVTPAGKPCERRGSGNFTAPTKQPVIFEFMNEQGQIEE